MIPLALNPLHVKIGLAGAGPLAVRRLAGLRAGGAQNIAVYAADQALRDAAGADALPFLPCAEDISRLHLLYVAGLPPEQHAPMAEAARAAKVLVNVEDVPEFCDFHAVAEIRRGDLLLTVSTGGAAPGLAGVIRRALETCFSADWAQRVADIATLRQSWRAEKLPMAEAAARIRQLADEGCWLSCPKSH